MPRSLAVGALVVASALFSFAQTTHNDPIAITLATQAISALTSGSSMQDVTLSGNVIRIIGSDRESGSATFYAKGAAESRVELDLSGAQWVDVRTSANGIPGGQWSRGSKPPVTMAQHNAWTDAAWFFPALSSLAEISNPNYGFAYIGSEQRDGLSVEHLRVAQTYASGVKGFPQVPRLSAMDFYLDPTSKLPLFETFNIHPDQDAKIDIPEEIRFADYRLIDGVQVPFHIQKLINGGLALDITITNATVNSGLTDSLFSLQ